MDEKSKTNLSAAAPANASKEDKSEESKEVKTEGENSMSEGTTKKSDENVKESEDNSNASDNKRSREASEDDTNDESLKKKGKKDESSSSSTSNSNAGSANSTPPVAGVPSKPSRGTRGSLSDKGEKGGNKAAGKRNADKRPSPPSSATNSPKKPASRDHSDEEDAEVSKVKSSGASSNEPKVPPLKIVLSGQNGNGGGTGSVVDDKKSPSGCKDESKEVEKPASTTKEVTASAASASAAATAAAASAASNATDIAENTNQSNSAVSEGMDDSDSKLGHGHGTRLTRSRANQGTPGPNDQGNDSPRESAMNQCENANLEPPSKETPATASGSNVASQQNSQSSSNSNLNYADYHVKKRKLRSQVEDTNANGGSNGAPSSASVSASGGEKKAFNNSNSAQVSNEPLNDIEKYLNIRKQVEQRRKNLFPVQPKPPEGFKDYLMNRKTYLLQENAHERLRSIPMIQPPHSLDGPLRDLFKQQEEERYKLRLKHVVEKEKLVLAVEQEILRVHGRAARALANQSLPYSVCTILRDEEIYTPIDPQQEEKNRDVRSRYNGRLFLSWLQDVDDKWEKIKEQMVLRHHNEAESLNAVQKMDWEWKVNEITGGTGGESVPQMDDLHIPMVNVSEDFDMSIL